MTGEEAKKIIKVQALNNPDYPLVCEAMNMAIEALEKQTEYWGMVTEAYRKLDEISTIVRYETGNRWEIEDKVLAVIYGSDNE